jgi:hypothetical protein
MNFLNHCIAHPLDSLASLMVLVLAFRNMYLLTVRDSKSKSERWADYWLASAADLARHRRADTSPSLLTVPAAENLGASPQPTPAGVTTREEKPMNFAALKAQAEQAFAGNIQNLIEEDLLLTKLEDLKRRKRQEGIRMTQLMHDIGLAMIGEGFPPVMGMGGGLGAPVFIHPERGAVPIDQLTDDEFQTYFGAMGCTREQLMASLGAAPSATAATGDAAPEAAAAPAGGLPPDENAQPAAVVVEPPEAADVPAPVVGSDQAAAATTAPAEVVAPPADSSLASVSAGAAEQVPPVGQDAQEQPVAEASAAEQPAIAAGDGVLAAGPAADAVAQVAAASPAQASGDGDAAPAPGAAVPNSQRMAFARVPE